MGYSNDGGNTYQNSNVFNGLIAGNYTVVVKDANNCVSNGQQVAISQPDSSVSFTTSQVNVLCNGAATGSITVTASGGTAPYSYSADGGNTYQNSNVFSGLVAGSYVVVVKDSNNCVSNGQVITISQPDSFVNFTTTHIDVISIGSATGSITVAASGGTAPYSYSDDGGNTYQSSNVFNGLVVGSYVVVVKDSNNCISNGQQVIISQQDSPVSLSTSQVNVLCNGAATGSIVVTASGGTAPYRYSDDGGTTYQDSNVFNGLVAGTYPIVAIDANNFISNVQQVIISQPDSPLNFTALVNCGSQTNEIIITATGGTMPYSYSKDNGTTYQASNIFGELVPASYPIVVKDENNCVASNVVDAGAAACDANLSIFTCCNRVSTGADTINYTITVKNSGANAATNVVVIDTLPKCAQLLLAAGQGWNITEAKRKVTAVLPQLSAGQSAQFTMKVHVTDCAQKMINKIVVTSDQTTAITDITCC